MKKFLVILAAALALLTLSSCQKEKDFGSPVGKYWLAYGNNGIPGLMDLKTKPDCLFFFNGDAAMNAVYGDGVYTTDAQDAFGEEYTLSKTGVNKYELLASGVKYIFTMLSEKVAAIDMVNPLNGTPYDSVVAKAVDAKVEYREPII